MANQSKLGTKIQKSMYKKIEEKLNKLYEKKQDQPKPYVGSQ